MIRKRITETKVEELIKRGASTPQEKVSSQDMEVTKSVQLRMPLFLIKEIDKLRDERKKKRIDIGKSRHDFLMEAILKAVNEGFKEVRKL